MLRLSAEAQAPPADGLGGGHAAPALSARPSGSRAERLPLRRRGQRRDKSSPGARRFPRGSARGGRSGTPPARPRRRPRPSCPTVDAAQQRGGVRQGSARTPDGGLRRATALPRRAWPPETRASARPSTWTVRQPPGLERGYRRRGDRPHHPPAARRGPQRRGRQRRRGQRGVQQRGAQRRGDRPLKAGARAHRMKIISDGALSLSRVLSAGSRRVFGRLRGPQLQRARALPALL